MSIKSDKTKEKLLSSMRRTKAGTGASESPTSPATATSETSASAEKMPAKAKPAAKTKAPAKNKAPVKAPSADSYQSGCRIWPD